MKYWTFDRYKCWFNHLLSYQLNQKLVRFLEHFSDCSSVCINSTIIFVFVFLWFQIQVSALKEKVAAQTGVPVVQQRLIFRGKVLKDDHLLSEYRILHISKQQCCWISFKLFPKPFFLHIASIYEIISDFIHSICVFKVKCSSCFGRIV